MDGMLKIIVIDICCRERTNENEVTITTWQSVYNLDKTFFADYDVIIGDEAHLFKSKSLVNIMDKLHHAKYRFGFTGTLDGTQTHKWVLEGCLVIIQSDTN